MGVLDNAKWQTIGYVKPFEVEPEPGKLWTYLDDVTPLYDGAPVSTVSPLYAHSESPDVPKVTGLAEKFGLPAPKDPIYLEEPGPAEATKNAASKALDDAVLAAMVTPVKVVFPKPDPVEPDFDELLSQVAKSLNQGAATFEAQLLISAKQAKVVAEKLDGWVKGGWEQAKAVAEKAAKKAAENAENEARARRLAELIPDARAVVDLPCNCRVTAIGEGEVPVRKQIWHAIQHLNDLHLPGRGDGIADPWTRERIAEWLETLDLDLRVYPTPEEAAAARLGRPPRPGVERPPTFPSPDSSPLYIPPAPPKLHPLLLKKVKLPGSPSVGVVANIKYDTWTMDTEAYVRWEDGSMSIHLADDLTLATNSGQPWVPEVGERVWQKDASLVGTVATVGPSAYGGYACTVAWDAGGQSIESPEDLLPAHLAPEAPEKKES
jgi:hypothetical protein